MKTPKPSSKTSKVKRPNPILYLILGGLLKLFGYIKGHRIMIQNQITRPSIVLSNHTSFHDFIYTTNAVYPKRITYIAADKLLYQSGTKPFLKLARAIPKSLFETDLVAIRKAFDILKQQGIIGIFPEGQISAIGDTLPFNSAIAKLIKKAKVEVFVARHRNAYFVNPPWSKKTFKGRITTKVLRLLTVEEVNAKTIEEIHEVIALALHNESAKYCRERHMEVKKNDYTNLENLIYQCPNCNHLGLENHKTHLHCPKCQSSFDGFENGMFGNIPLEEAFYHQRDRVEKEWDEHPDTVYQSSVFVESYQNDQLVLAGEGILRMDQKGYYYQGTHFGTAVDLFFSAKSIPTLPSDIGRNVQIYDGKQLYQFAFKDHVYQAQQYVFRSEYLYRILNR